MRPTVWIVGCGDIGCRLALLLQAAQATSVIGWVRSERSAEALARLAISAMRIDLDAPLEAFISVPSADTLIWLAPPPSQGLRDSRLRVALSRLRIAPRRLIYLSTTAVYGDCEGRWIDEGEALKPGTERGHRRADAEAAALKYGEQLGCQILILRVPGIYGPGRLPQLRLRAGTPILREDQAGFSNRVHADDLAAALQLLAISDSPHLPAIYNISDGSPTTMTDYLLRCAGLQGLPAPEKLGLDELRDRLTPMQLSFLEESRRIRSDRLRALGWLPRYPDLASGLPSCLQFDAVTQARCDCG